jgi:putative NADPH-quinone reductase
MAVSRILIIDGHPDPRPERWMHALTAAYRSGAMGAGHETRIITVAALDFPLLRTLQEFEKGTPPSVILDAQRSIEWANHIVIFFPLWLGGMPALLKGFFEQVMRPGFAFGPARKGLPKKRLKKRTVRIVVTMGMPRLFYTWFYRAHSLKSLERNILGFSGLKTIGATIIGLVGNMSAERREGWMRKMAALGAAAA